MFTRHILQFIMSKDLEVKVRLTNIVGRERCQISNIWCFKWEGVLQLQSHQIWGYFFCAVLKKGFCNPPNLSVNFNVSGLGLFLYYKKIKHSGFFFPFPSIYELPFTVVLSIFILFIWYFKWESVLKIQFHRRMKALRIEVARNILKFGKPLIICLPLFCNIR